VAVVSVTLACVEWLAASGSTSTSWNLGESTSTLVVLHTLVAIAPTHIAWSAASLPWLAADVTSWHVTSWAMLPTDILLHLASVAWSTADVLVSASR